jgi:hypothetical protein
MSQQGVYAIIGRGFAAAVNLSTLLLTDFGRTRIGGRKVVLIGQQDLWSGFYPHLMGQRARLLALPAFINQPTGEDFLWSSEFARIVAEQYHALTTRGCAEIIDRLVKKIRRLDEDFEILDPDRKSILRADKIDICTGPGSPKVKLDAVFPEELVAELAHPPGRPRRMYSGHTFLSREQVPNDGSVCVIGGGPVGSLCCERLLANDEAKVLWVNLGDLGLAFPPSGRFDSLAMRAPVGWKSSRHGLRIAGGYALDSVKILGGKIALKFTVVGDRQWQEDVDTSGRTLETLCDAVIISTGLNSELDDLFEQSMGYEEIISNDLRMTVGLKKYNGDIRVLGAAATNHDSFWVRADERTGNPLRPYINSLSRQILLPPQNKNLSILLNARLIGEANDFFLEHAFDSGPNWNAALITNAQRCMRRQNLGLSEEAFARIRARRIEEVLITLPPDANGIGDVIYSRRKLEDYSL